MERLPRTQPQDDWCNLSLQQRVGNLETIVAFCGSQPDGKIVVPVCDDVDWGPWQVIWSDAVPAAVLDQQCAAAKRLQSWWRRQSQSWLRRNVFSLPRRACDGCCRTLTVACKEAGFHLCPVCVTSQLYRQPRLVAGQSISLAERMDNKNMERECSAAASVQRAWRSNRALRACTCSKDVSYVLHGIKEKRANFDGAVQPAGTSLCSRSFNEQAELLKQVEEAIRVTLSVDSGKYKEESLKVASLAFVSISTALPEFDLEDIGLKLRWSYYFSIGSSQGPHRSREAERFDAVLRERGILKLRDEAAHFIIAV